MRWWFWRHFLLHEELFLKKNSEHGKNDDKTDLWWYCMETMDIG